MNKNEKMLPLKYFDPIAIVYLYDIIERTCLIIDLLY